MLAILWDFQTARTTWASQKHLQSDASDSKSISKIGQNLARLGHCKAKAYSLHCKRSALSFAEHGLGYDLRIELFPD